MFKYRFVCDDESKVRSAINQMIMCDTAIGKGIWCNDLYDRGIHFTKNDRVIKGFFIEESEDETHRGSPIRIVFSGRFINDDKLLFEVYIYPSIIELSFLLFMFVSLTMFGKYVGFVISILVLAFFIKGYGDMIKETVVAFDKLFKRCNN